VLVLGTSQWSGPPTARSLSRAGFRVDGGWEGGRLTGKTRYCGTMYELPHSGTSEFVDAVDRVCAEAGVSAVVPLADELLGALLRSASPERAWTLVGPDYETFRRLSDKAELPETAAAAGIVSPRSALITPHGLQGEQPPFPAYVKVIGGSVDGRPVGRPLRVTDQRSFQAAVDRLVANEHAGLVQEEIVGPQWRFHFARHRGRTAHLAARTLGNYPFHVGQSTISQFTATPRELEDVALRLLEHVGYEGVGVIQFVHRDGVWFIHDVNLRMPSSVGGTVAAGLDMPRLAVELALGLDPPIEPVRIRPLRIVQLPGEVEALREAVGRRHAERSALRILGGIAGAALLPRRRLTPFDPTDPLPTLAAFARLRRNGR
jgi:carbamoyl-phosphate synthase large subunit